MWEILDVTTRCRSYTVDPSYKDEQADVITATILIYLGDACFGFYPYDFII